MFCLVLKYHAKIKKGSRDPEKLAPLFTCSFEVQIPPNPKTRLGVRGCWVDLVGF
jgi:hypothetical protein